MCYSVKVPTKGQMELIPVDFERDAHAWTTFRRVQQWEREAAPEEIKVTLGLSRKPRASQFQLGEAGDRIYPKHFLPVIVADDNHLWLRPLRYALRPYWADKELASKYCTYNARLDSILQRRTWSPLLGRHHALIPFAAFYENVRGPGGKRLELQFTPQGKELIWAPALWDHWHSASGVSFDSVALITDDPPEEVLKAGHDRCPIFMAGDAVEEWLHPDRRTPAEWKCFLEGNREEVFYEHQRAA